jgi:molybdopterin-containing oxidoreductase family membrane subunit
MTTATYGDALARYVDFGKKPGAMDLALMVFGALSGIMGLAFVFYMLFTEGHAAFNTSSDMAWGAPIAFYLFFLLTSSGLSIIASLDSVFGLRVFYPLAKRAVFLSLLCLIAGFSILALEIGRPFRMLWALPFSLQVRSPMWWMGVLYSIDLVLLFIKFYLIHTGDWHSRLSHFVARLSFVICILAPGTLGLVFGMMAMRPAWFSNIMPMYFILTGFTTAVSFMLFFSSLLPRDETIAPNVNHLYHEVLPRLFFIALLAVIGMRFGQIITGLWSNFEGMEAHWLQLQSPFFWIEIVVGLALPTALMAFDAIRRRPWIQFVAASLFNTGVFFSRLELLIAGQKVPLFKGYWAGYVEYWPSLTEWMLIPAGCGIFLFLYGAGNWLLRLSETGAENHRRA